MPYRENAPPEDEDENEEEDVEAEKKGPPFPMGWLALMIASIEGIVFYLFQSQTTFVVLALGDLAAFCMLNILGAYYRRQDFEESKKKKLTEEEKYEVVFQKAVCRVFLHTSTEPFNTALGKQELQELVTKRNSNISVQQSERVVEWAIVIGRNP